MSKNKVYFASDLHLGAPALNNNKLREKLFVNWLDDIKSNAKSIYLLGDIFDFWYEYKKVIPKGYVRFLGKLAELTDSGIEIFFFTGNHDLWAKDYLQKEIGLTLYKKNIETHILGKSFYLGHGDEVGKYDKGYMFLKKMFSNKFIQWCFSRLHPNLAFSFAHKWSGHSRLKNGKVEADNFRGENQEFQILYAKDLLKNKHYDYIIFGHRHIPCKLKINNTLFLNTGDWVTHFTYIEFDGDNIELKKYDKKI